MALNVKKKDIWDDGLKMMALAKVPEQKIKQFDKAGHGAIADASGFYLYATKDQKSLVLGHVGFTNLAELKSGTLGAGVVVALQTLLEKKITQVLGEASALAKLPEAALPAKDKPQPTEAHTMWDTFTEDLMTTPTVALAQASRMYQPVRGTSNGSRYFCVAGSENLKVGCRFQEGTLSIRVEGPLLATQSMMLKALGFTYYSDKGYASVHLTMEPSDPNMPNKALGALIAGMGLTWNTPYPDAKRIHNKGA